jgi:hypothetical protein
MSKNIPLMDKNTGTNGNLIPFFKRFFPPIRFAATFEPATRRAPRILSGLFVGNLGVGSQKRSD